MKVEDEENTMKVVARKEKIGRGRRKKRKTRTIGGSKNKTNESEERQLEKREKKNVVKKTNTQKRKTI